MSLVDELHRSWVKHGRRAREMGFWAVVNHRVGARVAQSEHVVVRVVGSRCYGLASLILDVAAGLQLHREVRVGPDVHLIHGWNIKVHPDVVIGARVSIMHDVTIGTNGEGGVPRIGDDVFIGCGARILGDVTIGNGARIAANSVVLNDVAAGAMAVGVPARVVRYPAPLKHTDRAAEQAEAS